MWTSVWTLPFQISSHSNRTRCCNIRCCRRSGAIPKWMRYSLDFPCTWLLFFFLQSHKSLSRKWVAVHADPWKMRLNIATSGDRLSHLYQMRNTKFCRFQEQWYINWLLLWIRFGDDSFLGLRDSYFKEKRSNFWETEKQKVQSWIDCMECSSEYGFMWCARATSKLFQPQSLTANWETAR